MKCFSYVIPRDYGFAPNPFGDYCTLATCKPNIRNKANIGDWVIGTGSAKYRNISGKLIYAMRIDEKLTFDDYWNDLRFRYKKPIFNGSLKQTYGDNIYHSDNAIWIQENSHHSLPDGSENLKNKERDLKSNYVLISEYFLYFGKDAIDFPQNLRDIFHIKRIGEKSNFLQKDVKLLVRWLEKLKHKTKFIGVPYLFNKNFVRYDGS